METRKLTTEELGEKVLFPRTQHHGVSCANSDDMPTRQDFSLYTINGVPGMKSAELIKQTEAPHMNFQLIKASSEEQFDNFLGTLLGMHDVPSYVEGRTDFMVLFIGSDDGQHITQENHKEVYRHICRIQDQAARWYHLYGNL